MSATRFKQLLTGVSIAGALTFLFLNSQSVNIEENNRLTNHLREMKQLDATLTEESLEARFGLLTNYDTLVATLRRLKAIEAAVKQQLATRPAEEQIALKPLMTAYADALAQKEDLIEQFKSHNAVLKNSLQYLPVAARHAAQGGDVARSAGITALLRDLLVYNLNSEPELKADLQKQMGGLERAQRGYASAANGDMAILLAHARIVLERKGLSDSLIGQVAALPAAQRGNDLSHAFDTQNQNALVRANRFRFGLYTTCLALVAYVALILWRLKQSSVALNRANDTLEERVLERTGELAAANDTLDDMVSNMRAVLAAITRNADAVANTSAHLTSSATQATRTMGRLTHCTKAMGETANQAEEVAKEGSGAVQQTITSIDRIQQQVIVSSDKVRELGDKGQSIGVIVDTIQQIAGQTNLLALNAAVEAARAGQHGRGFVVVASEVRKLAERAALATREINALVGGMQSGVQEAVEAMEASAQEVKTGTSTSGEAKRALREILDVAQSVATQVGAVRETSQEMLMPVQEVSQTAKDLSDMAAQLHRLVEKFHADPESKEVRLNTVARQGLLKAA